MCAIPGPGQGITQDCAWLWKWPYLDDMVIDMGLAQAGRGL